MEATTQYAIDERRASLRDISRNRLMRLLPDIDDTEIEALLEDDSGQTSEDEHLSWLTTATDNEIRTWLHDLTL